MMCYLNSIYVRNLTSNTFFLSHSICKMTKSWIYVPNYSIIKCLKYTGSNKFFCFIHCSGAPWCFWCECQWCAQLSAGTVWYEHASQAIIQPRASHVLRQRPSTWLFRRPRHRWYVRFAEEGVRIVGIVCFSVICALFECDFLITYSEPQDWTPTVKRYQYLVFYSLWGEWLTLFIFFWTGNRFLLVSCRLIVK